MRTIFAAIALIFIGSCSSKEKIEADQFFEHQVVNWNYHLTNVIISDIFSPPVASRIYAYCNIAAYEAARFGYPELRSLSGRLNELPSLPAPENPEATYAPLAAYAAFCHTAKKLVFGNEKIQSYEERFIEQVKQTTLTQKEIETSLAYGRKIGAAILDWASKDGYVKRQAMARHILSGRPGSWEPTPPGYMSAIEPNWYMIRPFTLDSAAQFSPPPPTPFDTIKGSAFYEEAMEVYQAVIDSDSEKREIASFWDCNPNIAHPSGHAIIFTQKISPAGHWITIAGIASKMADLPFEESCKTHTFTSIALADAFIACWDTKFKTDLIRPVTYIQRYIDPEWEPVLQTPPFPEYTSGHSVISSAAAVTLTSLLGENFAFNDTTEVRFGLPERAFDSFLDASAEASVSRMYGGIHYRPAIEHGSAQGKKIGRHVLKKLDLEGENVASVDGLGKDSFTMTKTQ